MDAIQEEALVLSNILSFLSLKALLSCRAISRNFRDAASRDCRWLPIIMPPSLVADTTESTTTKETLSLVTHGSYLIRLYAQYRRWLKHYRRQGKEHLRMNYTTALDGFFSLAPWDSPLSGSEVLVVAADGRIKYTPVDWLQQMVYRPQDNNQETPKRRRSKRLRPSPDVRQSHFYQQRERDEEEAFRTFFSIPVGISDAFHIREPLYSRCVVQPLDVRLLDSNTPWPWLPNLNSNLLRDAPNVAQRLLECYLPMVCDAQVAPPATFLCRSRRHCPRDAQDAVLEDGTLVHQILVRAFADHNNPFEDEGGEDAVFVTHLVEPHLRPSCPNLAWSFDSEVGTSSRWVVSTFQFEQHLAGQNNANLRMRSVVRELLYCILYNGVELEICESAPCCLNNSDSVSEAASTSLLLCPGCLRKLQWMGVLHDVPACLRGIYRVLNEDPALREVSSRDLEMLRAWGYGGGGD